MLKRITPEVIDGWIERESRRGDGELEAMQAKADAIKEVLKEVVALLSPTQQLAVFTALNGSAETYVSGQGYVVYTDSAEVEP